VAIHRQELPGARHAAQLDAATVLEARARADDQITHGEPEKFAERALRAVLRGDAIVVVPAWWKALWYVERLSPALSMRVAKASLKRLRDMASTAS
jgi:short-subunit dehydrogenase